MNSLLKSSLAIFFTLNLTALTVPANDVFYCQPNVPAGLWEQHPEGVVVAVIFTYPPNDPLTNTSLSVYIKNTSTTAKLFDRNDYDSGVKVFYIDASGAKVPLHDYTVPSAHLSKKLPFTIEPGTTICVRIGLNLQSYSLLKTHPVMCSFTIYDPTTKQRGLIETSPKILGKMASE